MITIIINTDNSAFEGDNLIPEVKRILEYAGTILSAPPAKEDDEMEANA